MNFENYFRLLCGRQEDIAHTWKWLIMRNFLRFIYKCGNSVLFSRTFTLVLLFATLAYSSIKYSKIGFYVFAILSALFYIKIIITLIAIIFKSKILYKLSDKTIIESFNREEIC